MSGRRRGGAPLALALPLPLPLPLALALGGLLLPGQATVVAAQEPARPPPSTADGEPVRAPPAAVRNPFADWLESTEYRRPPEAWKCDALFYDAGDGCDCGCGAVDPDCNRLHHAEGGELEDMLWGCGDGEHCAEGACEPPPEPTGLSFKVTKPCEPSGAGRGAGTVYRLRVQAPRGTRFLVLYGPHRGRNALSAGLGFKVPQAAARCGGTEIHLGSAGLKVGGRVVKQVKAKQKVRVVTKEPFVEKAMCEGLHFQLVNLDTCTATSAVAGQEGEEGREQPCPSIYDGRADADFGESLASHSPRVVNGAGTRGCYPWMASFLDPHPKATQENGLSNPAFCGGAVVNDKFVVTAAHCMFGDAKRGDPVLIGHNRLSNAESCCGRSEMRRIAKITMHPKYPKTREDFYDNPYKHDIAVVELDAPIQHGWSICPQKQTLPNKHEVVAIGYGLVERDSWTYPPDNLQVGPSTVRPDSCPYWYFNLDKMLCHVGKVPGERVNTCFGDSGAPVFYSQASDSGIVDVLAGVVSAGGPSCSQGDTATRVSAYRDFLKPFLVGSSCP